MHLGSFRKKLIIFAAIAALLNFPAANSLFAANSNKQGFSASKEPVQIIPQSRSKYFRSHKLVFSTGESIQQNVISGPPSPPPGYDLQRKAVPLPKSFQSMGTKSLVVPAYNWVFGCSSVSAAMIAGYYDRNGFPRIYTGPTDGGVMPLNNSSWPTWSDGFNTYPNLPLAGSRQGVDGRTTRGSLDNYWVQYGSSDSDPYISQGWAEHSWGDTIGDYMKTSQSVHDNIDGATAFYTWSGSATRLTCEDMAYYSFHTKDGTYGRKLFYEARGYTVTDCYNQVTDNNIAGGFSFEQFKAEIDVNRPVLLNLAGHSVVGVGYDNSSYTVYIHDTWDYSNHTMTWGEGYSGMGLLSVSIVNLRGAETPAPPNPPGTNSTAIMPWINLLLKNKTYVPPSPPPSDPCMEQINFGQTKSGNWEEVCSSTHRIGSFAKYYTFSTSSIKTVTIDLESSVDTYMYLLSGQDKAGAILYFDDDGGNDFNSRILESLPPGNYTIEATTYFSEMTGSFTVTLN